MNYKSSPAKGWSICLGLRWSVWSAYPHLDAEQKIRLGELWAGKAGNNYRYFMVYDKRKVSGSYKLDDFINIIKAL